MKYNVGDTVFAASSGSVKKIKIKGYIICENTSIYNNGRYYEAEQDGSFYYESVLGNSENEARVNYFEFVKNKQR